MKLRKPPSSPLLMKVMGGIYLATFISIMVLAYTGNIPTGVERIPYYDKIGHLLLYALAAYLGHRLCNYRRLRVQSLMLPLFPFLFGIFTIVEEGIQAFSPNRSLDAIDLIASFLGIGCGYWLAEKGRNSSAADDRQLS